MTQKVFVWLLTSSYSLGTLKFTLVVLDTTDQRTSNEIMKWDIFFDTEVAKRSFRGHARSLDDWWRFPRYRCVDRCQLRCACKNSSHIKKYEENCRLTYCAHSGHFLGMKHVYLMDICSAPEIKLTVKYIAATRFSYSPVVSLNLS